ncbi:hypothetical protein FPZ44_23775 [Paenibacillus agilis]|uniref:Uncharacterized protein n=1 Tax=Paenibacillus agilis TaxID=3020863 RepID=A0A559IEB0_9BACL|nr:hypothetical protein FPZ44_23775 [Paenibacillus agilis]
MSRCCANCFAQSVDESKQNFYYRDWQGNKWDASCRPICDLCIQAGEHKDEEFAGEKLKRLYLGSSRLYKPKETSGYGWY